MQFHSEHIFFFFYSSTIIFECIHVKFVDSLLASGMDAPPRGEGGFPAPPRTVGKGGSPPRKNDQNRGEIAGQNKGPYLNFLQKRKLMMEQYHNTEHEWTMPNPACQ